MRKHGTMILLILIPVLILGLVSVMSNIVSNKNIKSVNNSASEIADNSMLSIEALGEIRQDTQSLHTQALSHIVATDLDSMLDIVEGLRDTQSGLAASLDEYEQFVSADDQDNFQALKDGIDQFNYHLADLLAFSGAGENEKAYALANGELSDSADNVEAVAAKLIASATAGADNARSDLNNVSQDSVRLTMVLILVSAAAFIAAVTVVVLFVIRPFVAVKNEIRGIISDIDRGGATSHAVLRYAAAESLRRCATASTCLWTSSRAYSRSSPEIRSSWRRSFPRSSAACRPPRTARLQCRRLPRRFPQPWRKCTRERSSDKPEYHQMSSPK